MAEFKFIQWRGADAMRQNSLFIDLFNLVEYETNKKRCLYIVNKNYAIRFLIGQRSINSVLEKNNIAMQRFRNKYNISSDFILYVGRIDGNKGCGHLFDYFIKYKKENKSNLKLVLIGKAVMEVPKNPDMLHLGFLPESDKFDGIKAAKILIMPSEYESYSIVVTEAFSLGIPTLANERCAVLKGHCIKSNGGLYYTNYEEFKECLNLLLRDSQLCMQIGKNARRYVEENYGWERIEEKYIHLLARVANKRMKL